MRCHVGSTWLLCLLAAALTAAALSLANPAQAAPKRRLQQLGAKTQCEGTTSTYGQHLPDALEHNAPVHLHPATGSVTRKLLQAAAPAASPTPAATPNVKLLDPASYCACSSEFDPVCGSDSKVHSNECRAKCAGVAAVGVPLVSSAGTCIGLGEPCRSCHPVAAWQPRLNNVSKASPCGCTDFAAPVCGSDNVTYVNQCWAKCANLTDMELAPRGVPGSKCAHPKVDPIPDWAKCKSANWCDSRMHLYPPGAVCGSDGLAYANRCEAECAGVTAVRDAPAGVKWLQPCPRDNPTAKPPGCGCPDTVDPVCVVIGGYLFKNECEAKCANATLGQACSWPAPSAQELRTCWQGLIMEPRIVVAKPAALGRCAWVVVEGCLALSGTVRGVC